MNQNRQEAIRWFSQAERDLKAAQISSSGNSYEWACFQSQQSADKVIKSLLILTGRRRIINYSLFELLLEASKNHPVLMELKRSVKHLDGVYFSTRYPDSIAGDITPGEYYDKEDAEECIHQAENILKAVKNILNI